MFGTYVEPSIGTKAGFGGIILHGLGSYGFVVRGILNSVAGGDPAALKAINARFTSPVKPNGRFDSVLQLKLHPTNSLIVDTLETKVWEIGPGPDGTIELGFVTLNLTTGKPSLGGGVAYVKKAPKSKL